MQLVERHIESSDWITILIFACLVLISLSKFFYPKRFQEFVMLPLTNKYFLVQGRNTSVLHPFNVLLFIVQTLSISLFIFILFQLYDPGVFENKIWFFFQICLFYMVFVLVKFCIEKIVGIIFSIEGLIDRYLYQKLTFRNLISIFLLIVNLVFIFIVKPSMPVVIGTVIVILAVNALTLFYSYKTNGNLVLRSFFYFILYLCALEISPYVILYKVLV